MVKRIQAFLPALLLASVVTLSGCASSDSDKEMKPDSEAMGAPESLDSKPVITEGRTDGPMLPIYFDFDSSDVRQDAVKRLENNADYLKSSGQAIVIEGNCDPRGTKEYNLALGERRALAAKKYLENLGVESAQMSTVSYGEERLENLGTDETAMAENRRDDFVKVK